MIWPEGTNSERFPGMLHRTRIPDDGPDKSIELVHPGCHRLTTYLDGATPSFAPQF